MTIEDVCKTVKKSVILSDYTSVKIGGICDTVAYPEWGEFYSTLSYLDCKVPYVVLGRGSNTLISDSGFRGVVVTTAKLSLVEVDSNGIVCQCGASLPKISKIAKEHSLSGLEWAVGIPASIGGALVTNAGAYGGCIGDIVEWAEIFRRGKAYVYDGSDLDFGYRHSKVSDLGTVGRVKLRLSPDLVKNVEEREREIRIKRASTQPVGLSLGSVFKAHNGVSAGYYLDKAGLKGVSIGGAMISDVHAGFIINRGGATAKDYLALIELAEEVVAKKYGIKLQREIKLLGEI